MFDRALVDTDRFMDLPMTSKALYFLLGMEADDEGFVSPKKVLRIHGGSDDDVKVLIAKRFLIPFESGVVVITDWNKNNWLDSRRVRPTEYQKEKQQLVLTDGREYVLSTCLADAKREEYRIEENRVEQSRGVAAIAAAPVDLARDFFNQGQTYDEIRAALVARIQPAIVDRELSKFVSYWTEPNKTGSKQRWQLQQTFDVKRRLHTWLERAASDYQRKAAPKGKGIIV